MLVEFSSGILRRTNFGALIEGPRTNLAQRSQAFNSSPWDRSGATITADAATAPDGTMTADVLTEDANTVVHRTFQQIGLAANTQCTFSFFTKRVTGARNVFVIVQIGADLLYCRINLATGAVIQQGAGGTASGVAASTVAFADGSWRISLSGIVSTISSNPFAQIYMANTATADGPTAPLYAGNGTSSIALWGAQFEAAPFASSYVKTDGGAVLRQADQITASLSGVAYPLSLYAEFVRNGDTGAAEGVLQVDASSRAQRGNINVSSSDTLAGTVRGGANDGDSVVSGVVTVGAVTKSAGRFALDNVRAARGGTLATADTTASIPTASPTTVRFGDFGATANYGFIYLLRAAVIPGELADAQLQAITT
jgi:hypothetical protein